MVGNVLEYLERSAELYPDKQAYEDENKAVTFSDIRLNARKLGCVLAKSIGEICQPVAVFMDKNVDSILSFFSVLYSGNFYCPLDSHMPKDRIKTILSVLRPRLILTDSEHKAEAEEFAGECRVITIEERKAVEDTRAENLETWKNVIENDPLYVLFTSGSTGVPKGVLLPHKVIINYLEWLDGAFDINENDVFGNQAPLYFDVSMHDVYGALYFGAKMVIIPQMLFSFPLKLIEFMNDKKITTFLWVPSAMGIVAKLKTFDVVKPEYLRHAMFAGEVLPRPHLDYWAANLPEVTYANLYGPTETFVCTYYIMKGNEEEGQPLPIGRTVANSRALILSEDGKEVSDGATGVLCLEGACLALGYYGNDEKTQASFVQNPLNKSYPERIYYTGDLVYRNSDGEIIYVSRKDFQIKHMGYRIELGEIENAGNTVAGIKDCVCTYNTRRQKIIFYYEGEQMDKKHILDELTKKIPQYMLPGKIVYMESLPHNANGKIDRKSLEN